MGRQRRIALGLLTAAALLMPLQGAIAGPFEDGASAYRRGDFRGALQAWGPISGTNAEAQNLLGVMYMDGKGVPRNYATALQWFERSAANRSSSGQNNLGGFYRDGRGVARDYAKAATFFAASAAQGNAGGQMNLGLMYMAGQGVRQDVGRAYMWFTLAAAQNFPRAEINRDQARKQLSSVEVDAAMRMAARCKQSSYRDCN